MFARTLTLALLLAPSAQAHPLKVVTSTTTLASITRSVGGEHVTVASICAADQDPHFIHARPSFMRLLADADLFIRVGLELEKSWEAPLLRGSRNADVQIGARGHLDVSAGVVRLGVPAGEVDRSMGDIHLLGNPHYWLDPYNGRLIAATIAERLGRLDRAHAPVFEKNLRAFHDALDRKMFGNAAVEQHGGDALWKRELAGERPSEPLGGWRARADTLRRSPVITFHKSWTYLAARFGIPVVDQLEPKPGIHPSPSHLVRVIKAAGAQNVRAILVEPYYDRKVADFVSAKTGVPVLRLPNAPGEETGIVDYLGMLDHAIVSIAVKGPS